MIETKQLQYFIVCSEVGSFSEAAEILYTTQSNVSKVVKALEKSVGARLFVRRPKGIALTARGRHVYRYACRIMEDMGALTDFSGKGVVEWLNLSCNPSSWFANRFVEFYQIHSGENMHCQVQTASVRSIMNRVRDCKDELGFVYVLDSQRAAFQYQLIRNQLEFQPLVDTDAMLYLGEGHPFAGENRIPEEELRKLRFIQNYQDEFTEGGSWSLRDGSALGELDVAVYTNSDYIMEKMLAQGQLANISGIHLRREARAKKGIPLKRDGEKVMFGYLKRKGEVLSPMAVAFVDYLKKSLHLDEK